MRSDKINKNLCETTGGGKFVPIPGFPGEKADRRLLTDIKYLRRKYDIFITDGLSKDAVHAANGEHPIGLALDIVPNAAKGGTWKEISRLAKRAEPQQNDPIAPFRWVGYNGDAGHGRGNHLHLSWNHSDTRPGHPAKTVYTLRCPGSGSTAAAAAEAPAAARTAARTGGQRRRRWRHPRRRRQGRRRWRRWHLPAAPDGSVRGPRRRSGHRDRRRRPPVAKKAPQGAAIP